MTWPVLRSRCTRAAGGWSRVAVPVVGLVGVLQVGGQDRLLDDLHQFVERDLPLALHETQDAEVDVHAGLLYSDLAAARRRDGLSYLRYPRSGQPGTPGTVRAMPAYPSRLPRRAAARSSASSPAWGYAAIGILHILIGVIALAVAFGAGGGDADQSGALQALVAVPGGLFVRLGRDRRADRPRALADPAADRRAQAPAEA